MTPEAIKNLVQRHPQIPLQDEIEQAAQDKYAAQFPTNDELMALSPKQYDAYKAWAATMDDQAGIPFATLVAEGKVPWPSGR
jgi:hypothetical protein